MYDLEAATRAVGDFLRGLCLDPDDPATPDLAETPRRLALADAELLDVPEFDFTTFANTGGYDELVLVRDIALPSVASTTCCRSPESRTSVVFRADA